MPIYPTVSIPVQFMLGASQAQLQQLARNITSLNSQINQLQQGFGATAGTIRRGVGSFWLMHRAMQASFGVIRAGIRDTSELELVMKRLQLAMGGTPATMRYLRGRAEDISGALGPISVVDVMRNSEALSHVLGITTRGLDMLNKPFSTFVSNMAVLSQGRLGPEAGTQLLQSGLNIFGGASDPRQARRVINALFSGMMAYTPTDPQRLLTVLRPLAATMIGQGFTPEQVVGLAGLATIMPSSGRAAGTAPLAFINRAIQISAQIRALRGRGTRGGARSASALEIEARQLGFIDPRTGEPVISPGPRGEVDIGGFMRSFAAAVERLRQHGPRHFAGRLGILLKDVLGKEQAVRFAQSLGLHPEALGRILERMSHMPDMQQVANELAKTTWVALRQLNTNLSTLATRIFDPANMLIGAGAHNVALAVADLVKMTRRDPHLAGTLGIGTIGLAGGSGLLMLGRLLGGLGAGGGLLRFAGGGLLMAGLLAGLLAGGIVLFRKTHGFRDLQGQLGNVISEWLTGALKYAVNTLIGRRTPEEIGSDYLRHRDSRLLEHILTGTAAVAHGHLTVPERKALRALFGRHKGNPLAALEESLLDQGGLPAAPAGTSLGGTARTAVMNRKAIEGLFAQAMQRAQVESYAMPGHGGGAIRAVVPATPGLTRGF